MKPNVRLSLVLSAIGIAVVGGVLLASGLFVGPDPSRRETAKSSPMDRAADREKDVAAALETMRKEVERKPEDFQARMALAAALGQSREYGEAMEQLRVAGRLNPKSAEPHLAMSDIFDVAYMLDMSLAAARAAVAVEPDSVRALTRLGQVTIGLDWNVAALRLMSDAVKQHPDAASLWVVLALVRYQMNDLRGALDAVATARRLEPNNRALDGTLIDIHLKLGNPTEALKAAEAAAGWQPESTIPKLGKARALRAMRRYEEAEEVASSALAIDPQNRAAQYDKALSVAALGRHDEAVRLLEPIVAENPLFERASVNLADAYTRIGRRDDATRVNQRFQSQEKKNDAAVRALLRVGNQPDNPDAHREAGRAHLAQGRVPRAVVEFAEAMRLKPGDSAIREDLAKALDAMQRTNEAQAVRGIAGGERKAK